MKIRTLVIAGAAIVAAGALSTAGQEPEGVFLHVRDGARVRVHDLDGGLPSREHPTHAAVRPDHERPSVEHEVVVGADLVHHHDGHAVPPGGVGEELEVTLELPEDER